MITAARNFGIIFVMASNEDESVTIAQALVGEKLAACVNVVGPLHSIYRWRGAMEASREYMLVIKAAMRDFSKLERRIRELHSYEVPEIIAVPLVAGSKPYIAWLAESTAAARTGPQRRRSVRS